MKTFIYLVMALTIGLFLVLPGFSRDPLENSGLVQQTETAKTDSTKKSDPSSPHGKDLGIGPVKEVKLGPIDEKLAQQGKSLFEMKCTMCHSLDERKIGPALRDVTEQRTPEFIMNLLVNTSEMEQKDETMKKLISEYSVPMTDLQLSEKDARAILEYLRSVAKPSVNK